VRLDKTDYDPPISLDIFAIHEHRLAVDSATRQGEPGRIEGAMVDDRAAAGDRVSQHRSHLRRRGRAMGAGPDHDGDVIRGDVMQLTQHPRHDPLARQRPRDVGDHDRHALVGLNHRRQRRAGERAPHCLEECRLFVGQAGNEPRRDDRHVVAGHGDLDAGGSVFQLHTH
jgi:hypothetical protein